MTPNEHFGYAPICEQINRQHGIDLGLEHTGGGCWALTADLPGGSKLYVTDGGDAVGSLTPLSQRTPEYDAQFGFAIGVYDETDDPIADLECCRSVDELNDAIGAALLELSSEREKGRL